MKKYVKYLTTFLLMFTALISSVSAVTIKETLIEGDGYSTIEDGSIVIGITKFSSDTVVTGGRATKAGSDAALMYIKLNGNADGFETPVIYVYAGGGWFALDKDNNASVVKDQAILDDLSNKDIYYVNDAEKLLDIDVSGINIDTSKLPKGVTYENGKIWVKATKDSVTVVDKDGAEYKYVKERGLFTLDKSECYQVNGNEITGYSNTCSKNVIIPSKVGDTEIVSVGADAFRNKGIKKVVIPNHIISLKDNAFADNSLESVTIEDKYDETDFDVYGQNVFGSFKDEDIVWKNDLTNILNQFDEKITIKVTDKFKEHEFEYKEEERYIYETYAKQQQIKKLGISADEKGIIYGNYNVMFWITSDEEMTIDIYKTDEDRYAYRNISYEVVTVEENNNDYVNIKEDYEEYFESVKTKMKNKDFSTKLTGIDGLIDIADEYNYEVLSVSNGFGDGPFKTDYEPDLVDKSLIYNDALHYIYEDMPYYDSIFYPITVNSEIVETNEIFAAMKEIFEQSTNITEYDAYYEDSYGTAGKVEYAVALEVIETNESFVLYYSKEAKNGELYLNYENEYGKGYSYYPTKTLSDFDGNVIMYFDNAFTELNEKYNTGMDYQLSSWVDSSDEKNADGLYDAIYTAELRKSMDNDQTYSYSVSVNNPKPVVADDIYSETFADFDDNKTKEEYEQDVLNVFFEKTAIKKYYIFEDEYEYYYDEEAGKYLQYYSMIDTDEILKGIYVLDFDTNTRYIVLYKDFYDRKPGTLFKDYIYTNEYDDVTNYYRYIPSTKYTTGKVSDYVESVKQELKTKANLPEDANFSFGFASGSCKDNGNCTVSYYITYNIYGEESYHYNAYFDLETDSSFEWEYIHNSTVNPEDYTDYKLYDNMVFSECINGLGLTDYYYYDNKYYLDEEYVNYELFDFENNRRIMIKAKRFALG